jgi:hypothetical protein
MKVKSKSEDVYEDELEEEELKEKKKEMKRLKMERDLLKLQTETEKVRQELSQVKSQTQNMSVSSNPDNQAMALGSLTASLIKAGIKPEQANEFFGKMNPEALAVLTSLTSNNPYLPIFMYLATQSRGQNPQTLTTKDVIDINKGVFELAEKIGGKDKAESGMLGIVKELTNMMRDLYQKQLLDKLDEVKNAVGGRSSIWEEIFEDERKFNMLKELFGGKTTKPETEIELEKLRQQHEINMKRLDLDLLKLRSEILEGRRKSKMFSQALRKIGEAIGEGLKESTTEEGTTYERQQTQQIPTTLKCPKCNTDIPDVKPDTIVTCPNCKSSYKVRVKQ